MHSAETNHSFRLNLTHAVLKNMQKICNTYVMVKE